MAEFPRANIIYRSTTAHALPLPVRNLTITTLVEGLTFGIYFHIHSKLAVFLFDFLFFPPTLPPLLICY